MSEENNYCGPDSSPSWVKGVLSADIIPGGKLNEACMKHDKDYATPGKSKVKSDFAFLGNSLKATWYNPYGWLKSIVYFGAVLFGGGAAYKAAQAKVQK